MTVKQWQDELKKCLDNPGLEVENLAFDNVTMQFSIRFRRKLVTPTMSQKERTQRLKDLEQEMTALRTGRNPPPAVPFE